MVNDCQTEPGKTTIKVHYLSCVKEPYTVYRQVEKEVGVKQPCYERVDVPITRHVCEHCGGLGCEFGQQCPDCAGSSSGGVPTSNELPVPTESSHN